MRDMMRQNTVEEPKIMELVGLKTIQVQSVYYTNTYMTQLLVLGKLGYG